MKLERFITSIVALIIFIPAFSQLEGYNLNYILANPSADNPIDDIIPFSENEFSRENTLDIVNWNVSWMGAPIMDYNKYGTRMEQICGIAQILVDQNADVFALQEVVVNAEGNALNDLLVEMNKIAGEGSYSGAYSEYHSFYWQSDNPDFPPQSLAYIWNNSTVVVNNDSVLLKEETSYEDFGYGRLPYLLDANVTINGKTQRYLFINIHLKAQSGYRDMRANSMALLKKLLDEIYCKNNVVLLGDYNVADASGALGEIADWGMYNDENNDGITDYVHAGGNKNNGIEHTLISDELFDELAYLPDMYRSMTINGTGTKLSDHYAYETSLYIHQNTDGTNSLSELFNKTLATNIYPNPAKDVINISSNIPVVSIELYSNIGELLLTKMMSNDEKLLDISELKSGFYFVNIRSINTNKVLKILKL